MPENTPQEKPKIIIDEDWKSQVRAEKERLQHAPEKPQEPQPSASQPRDTYALPPATFPVLLSTLTSQALVCLGQIENPLTGKAEIRLDEAKHFIDTLQMLEEKTKGNLTAEETAMLTEILHELRLSYVTAGGPR